jgi:alpha-L-glutamate ligase-like protein
MNARNLDFLSTLNPRRSRNAAGDKIITKELCLQAGIQVPVTYAVIDSFRGIGLVREVALEHGSFVMKPARGWGGNGVLVARPVGQDSWACGDERFALDDLADHAAAILSGVFSQGGGCDRVLLEEVVTVLPTLADICGGGAPDIRVLVCRAAPVMAMLRLPTRESSMRANLHQGAVGVGVDMSTGVTNMAALYGRPVVAHPDTGRMLRGVEVPGFASAVHVSVRAADCLRLGYAGVDVMVTPDLVPVVLEVNAQPGLGIQVANGRGLLEAMAEAGVSESC